MSFSSFIFYSAPPLQSRLMFDNLPYCDEILMQLFCTNTHLGVSRGWRLMMSSSAKRGCVSPGCLNVCRYQILIKDKSVFRIIKYTIVCKLLTYTIMHIFKEEVYLYLHYTGKRPDQNSGIQVRALCKTLEVFHTNLGKMCHWAFSCWNMFGPLCSSEGKL